MAWSTESRHARGYDHRWVKLRAIALTRDMHLCQPCLATGRATPATQVDHIIPKASGGTDDLDNLQSICAEHHAKQPKPKDGQPSAASPSTQAGFPYGRNSGPLTRAARAGGGSVSAPKCFGYRRGDPSCESVEKMTGGQMPIRGRKPKPTGLKVIAGTDRADRRNNAEPKPD